MEHIRDSFVTEKGLLNFAARHEDNSFLHSRKEKDRPLAHIFHRADMSYFLKLDENDRIVAAAAIRYYESLADYKQPVLWLSQISVRPECRNKKLGTSLLQRIFEHAERGKFALRMTPFETDGEKYLAPIIPRLHRDFPTVKILYESHDTPIDGTRTYEIINESGVSRLEFK